MIRYACVVLYAGLCTILHGQESGLFEPLSQIRITGTLTMPRGSGSPESSRRIGDPPQFAPPGSEKQAPLMVETLDEWMLGPSFVTRARGERIPVRQTQPLQNTGGLLYGNSSNTTTDHIPTSAVCGYQSDILPGSVARKQVFESGWEKDQAVSLAGDLSPADLPRTPHWMLQRIGYGLRDLPHGTTHTLTHGGGNSIINVSWPAKAQGKGMWVAERATGVWHDGQLDVTLYVKSWREGEPERSEFPFQHMRYSSFDPRFPAVARRVDMQHATSLPLVFEVTGIESISPSVTYDQAVAEAGRGSARQFRQQAAHDDEKLTASVFQLVDGSSVRLRDFRNKFLLLHFWASWAPDNEKRFSEVKEICKKHAQDKKFAAISVSLDDDLASAASVISRMKPDWPQVYLGPNADAVRGFPFESLPAAILVEPGENPALKEISRPTIGAITLFGKQTYGEQLKDAAAVVSDRLALEERRGKTGGVYAEMFGEAGRDALQNCQELQGFLVLHDGGASGDDVNGQQDTGRVAGIPVAYRWPKAPPQAMQDLARLLMKDENYKFHRYRMESDDPPSGPGRVISFRHGGNTISFIRVYTDDGLALEPVITPSGDDGGRMPLLFPTVETNKKIDAWLEKWTPDTQETSAALGAKSSERRKH